MSYAQVAASGLKQSPEEARAPPIPEVVPTEESTHSLVHIDSPRISSIPSDFDAQSVKTDTQIERSQHEAEGREKEPKSTTKEATQEAAVGKGKDKVSKASKHIHEGVGNPVALGNALAITAVAGVLGYGAYRKYNVGELSWKLFSAWAGIIGLFAVGDYYLANFLFRKYQPKK